MFVTAVSRCYASVRFTSYEATRTNMFINKSTKVICQGFTGKQVNSFINCVSSYASVVLGVVILFVCLSVTGMLCDKTKQCSEDILMSHKRANTLLFSHQ